MGMNCPACKSIVLVMSERGGVEIDYCPQCRGVWLDRGELDKIINQTGPVASAAAAPMQYAAAPHVAQNVPPPVPPPVPRQGYQQQPYRKRDDDDSVDEYPNEYRGEHRGEYPKRKKSWLKDVFDF